MHRRSIVPHIRIGKATTCLVVAIVIVLSGGECDSDVQYIRPAQLLYRKLGVYEVRSAYRTSCTRAEGDSGSSQGNSVPALGVHDHRDCVTSIE